MNHYKIKRHDIFEYQPGYRTISIFGRNGRPDALDRLWQIRLPFPYVVLIIRRDNNTTVSIGAYPPPSPILHVAFRNKPLDPDNLEEQELLFPTLPNVYGHFGPICCKPSPETFWQSSFSSFEEIYCPWPGVLLLEKLNLSTKKWSKLTIDQMLQLCEEWPQELEYFSNVVGVLDYNSPKINTYKSKFAMKYKLKNILNYRINSQIQDHIDFIAQREAHEKISNR